MNSWLHRLLFSLLLALAVLSPLHAQDPAAEQDGDSREVEESDEEYRRRMELEDARQRDLGYTLPAPTYAQKQEKLDKLPEESRDNIRDQLVDIIVENGDWEPSDALREYPYEPTAAAVADPELMQQEQEAWDEQIGKYHKREAAAYGTYLGPVPGPGNPDGGEGGGQAGESNEGTEQGAGQESGSTGPGAQQEMQGGAQGGAGAAAGSYDPYQSNRSRSEDAVSTAGVEQSALEFLKAMRGQEPAAAAPSTPAAQTEVAASEAAAANPQAAAEPVQADAEQQPAEQSSQQESESASDAEQQQSTDQTVEFDLTTPGIIAIKDLEKLEGTGATDATEKRE
jgi:hypothetical protein